ncbi:MAG: hypothetical protein KDA91_08805 [Planctomycetaceae bacterium]|nr:hypothetical protein [Planctomycetaceae bacterium]
MNRVPLRLYSPPAEDIDNELDADVIPFEAARRTIIFSGRFTEPTRRARLIRDNRTCPNCSHCDIEPLELQDAMISPKSRLPVPGTATIVGFHCNDCGTEWPVYEIRRNG